MGLASNMVGIYTTISLDDYFRVDVVFSDTKERQHVYFKKMVVEGEYIRLYDLAMNIKDILTFPGGYDFDGECTFIAVQNIGYIYFDAVDKITIYPPNKENSYILFEKLVI